MSDGPPVKIADQFRFHSVAIISLIMTIVGVSFNILQTRWIEENATVRDTWKRIALGELLEIVHHAHFNGFEAGDPIVGWSKVMVDDLAMLVAPENSPHCRAKDMARAL